MQKNSPANEGQAKKDDAQQYSKIEIIQQYWHCGFPLTPLNGKKPLNHGWPKTTCNPAASPPILHGNYGVVLQDDDLVIDADPRNYCEGDDALARLCADMGICMEETFTVKTGGGGYHVYLKKPHNLKVMGIHPDYKGVEFKTKGNQVVGPHSIHPDTRQAYTVLHGSPSQVMEAPETLLALVNKNNRAMPSTQGLQDYKDDKPTQQRFIDYLASAPLAIQGSGGDKIALQVAMYGRDFGLPPETTLELMDDHWNERCAPSWPLDELQTKVANAYRYAKSPLGNRHPSSVFSAISNKEPALFPV